MTGVTIPGTRARTRSRKMRSIKNHKERQGIRLTFYFITFVLLSFIVYSGFLYNNSSINFSTLEAYSSIALSLFFPFMVFSYLLLRGNSLKWIVNDLGLSKDRFTLKVIGIGILLFLSVLIFEVAISLFSLATNIQLPTNVQNLLAGTPIYFLVFTFLIAPIDEEILFRGFLVPRCGAIFRGITATVGIKIRDPMIPWSGIIISAAIFAILHLSYWSASEFAAAFFFGIMAGYVFTKTKSLYPSILAHMIVNLITVTSLIYLGMLIHP